MTRNRDERVGRSFGSSDYDYDYHDQPRSVRQADMSLQERDQRSARRGEVDMDTFMRGDYRRGDTDDDGQGFINPGSRQYVNDGPRQRQPRDGQWQYRTEENYVADQGRRELGERGYDDGRHYGQTRLERPSYGERREQDRWSEGPARQSVHVAGAYSAEQAMQSHRGKGPRGHQRSDERIREEVNEALEDSHWVDASDIEVTVEAGEVTLSGTVADRQQKRSATDCAEDVRGVRDVHNQLRLQSHH